MIFIWPDCKTCTTVFCRLPQQWNYCQEGRTTRGEFSQKNVVLGECRDPWINYITVSTQPLISMQTTLKLQWVTAANALGCRLMMTLINCCKWSSSCQKSDIHCGCISHCLRQMTMLHYRRPGRLPNSISPLISPIPAHEHQCQPKGEAITHGAAA